MTTLSKFFYVAIGGMVGAVLRYGAYVVTSSMGIGVDKIWVTAAVNIIGSFFLGCLIGLAQGASVDERVNLFVMVGVLGAFTTFSTFAVEGASLLVAGKGATFAAYALISNVASLLAAFGGILLFRNLVIA